MKIKIKEQLNGIGVKVACQGVEGAYSDKCARSVFPDGIVAYKQTFKKVFESVSSGECDYGVLPLENSTAGSVNEVYGLLAEYGLYVVASKSLEINHCLMGLKDAEIDSVKEVASHWQALTQCADFIAERGLQAVTATNTANACMELAANGNTSCAVIASEDCAEIYGLKILARSVQNNPINFTRFVIVSSVLEALAGSTEISVMCRLSNEPNSLSGLIAIFSGYGVNLRKIASQNIPNTVFEVKFFIDFDGSLSNGDTSALLDELKAYCAEFALLGSY